MAALRAQQRSAEEQNYARMRAFTNFLFDRFYRIQTEGELPVDGARVIVLPHQCSLDGPALIRAIDEPISFVYRQTAFLKMPFLGVVQAAGGIKVSECYVHVKRLFSHFDNNRLIAIFPQGLFETSRVTQFRCNLDGLIDLYWRKTAKEVTIIPAGLKYESPSYALANLPLPLFKFPFPGTRVTLTFGQPRLRNTSGLENLTETVMREAAALSELSYNGEPLHRKHNKPGYA